MFPGPPLAVQVKLIDSPALTVMLLAGSTITESLGDTGGEEKPLFSVNSFVIDLSLTSDSGIVGICYCIDHWSSGHTTIDSIVTMLHLIKLQYIAILSW